MRRNIEPIPSLKIFVSFHFDKDNDLKNNFFTQAKTLTQHRILNFSLNEAYPTEIWKNKARTAIEECDVVIVLIGQDTHNASGGIVETDIACGLNKPIIQIRPQGRPYSGLTRLGEPITWKWKNINRRLDEVAA